MEQQINYKKTMIQSAAVKLIFVVVFIIIVHAEPQEDQLDQIPGYPADFRNRAFAGYLKTSSDLRKIHYVFLESNKGVNNSAPLLLWFNGGPGCTSKLGLIMQIGPFCLNQAQAYRADDPLTPNMFSWSNITNLLFIDSPAGAGYSINQDPNFVFDDSTTSKDTFDALHDFFANKFPQYSNNSFYLAGQSYAGKYIPDLAARILADQANKINLKGLLMGNPTLNFVDLYANRVEWMISHNLIDPQLIPYWIRSCKVDADSAGCHYFYQRYQDLTYRIDEYNVYGQCYGRSGPPEQAIIDDIALRLSPFHKMSKQYTPSILTASDQWCSYSAGIDSYLNANAAAFKSKASGPFSACNMTIYSKYKVDPKGSILEFPSLLKKGLKVYLFTGDWDDVVPFTDTYKNLQKMSLKLQGDLVPWTVNDQHAGFIRIYSYNLTVFQVKGAGHEVPFYQRERAFRLFQKFIYA